MGVSVEDYEGSLESLARLLRRKAMTAQEIADAVGCTRVTAYARLRRLRKSGIEVEIERVDRDGVTGPRARAYRVR